MNFYPELRRARHRPRQSSSHPPLSHSPARPNPLSFQRASDLPHRSLSEYPMRMRVPGERSESKDLSRALTPLFATHPRNRLLSPIIATHPKTPSRNSFVCHTCDTPRGLRFRSGNSSSSLSAVSCRLLAKCIKFAGRCLSMHVDITKNARASYSHGDINWP